ncbi:hypothetical protein E1212_04415 [Jiangella ureilytica]|uniref:Uncharacterized protein n=1 Tax=Jiangella ureilytica TaxID=2530374 RepID=A0A4R4RVK1_9ACTN|nr:hypothetical protein [Jiangella ureilytica]TDC53734.1 hypothetical protein E1212_04415 [Jiangella ureilytica]
MSDLDPELEAFLRTTLIDHAADAPAGDDLAAAVTRVGRAQRRRHRLTGGAVALALGAVAVLAGSQLGPFADDVEAPPAGARRDLGTGVGKALPPEPSMRTCDGTGWPAFDVALLTERPPVDPSSDLGQDIAGSDLDTSPVQAARWALAGQVGNVAYLLGWTSSGAVVKTMFRNDNPAGTWTRAGAVEFCELQLAFADGRQPASWSLAAEPGPEATTIRIHLLPPWCAEGYVDTAPDLLTDVLVDYRDDSVVVTPLVRPPAEPETHSCEAGEPSVVDVDLAGPLGDRQLLDGRWDPPRPVGQGA